jgi:hypothetical protein
MGEHPGDIRQRDLAAELGIKNQRMKQIRAEHLCSTDWYSSGRGGVIWIRPEGQRKLRIWAEARDDVPHVAHHFLDGIVLGPLPHPEWLAIKVKDGIDEWVKVPCRVPRKLKRRFHVGKKIRVEVIQSNNETAYRHESYADYPIV